jgi:hypothetical protein
MSPDYYLKPQHKNLLKKLTNLIEDGKLNIFHNRFADEYHIRLKQTNIKMSVDFLDGMESSAFYDYIYLNNKKIGDYCRPFGTGFYEDSIIGKFSKVVRNVCS